MNFFNTYISPESIELAVEALRSTYVSEGKLVRQFEEELAATLGIVNPLALNSGTTALHLPLVVAGIGPGDEVILPPQTFVATGLVILMQGAVPVFADIQPTTGNLDPASFREKITPRTRAVIPVHWGGYPCDMDEINAIAAEHDLAVIEDAAHALGAVYRGRPVGSISRFTAFSFQAIKHVTTGDGGALASLEEADHEDARVRRWFGIDRARSSPSILGEREYDIDRLGFKYHMNDLAAAVGLGNLRRFGENLARQRDLDALYRRELAGVPGVELLDAADDRRSACWLFTLLVERREDFIRKLAGREIPASVVHRRIDHNTIFGGIREDLPGQERFNERQVAIPIHAGLGDDDLDLIIRTIREGW